MPSVIDIVNRGLDKLGHGAITSLGDGSKAANLATRTWPIVRDQILRSYPWNFAITRTTLAPLSTSPIWGYNYQFELPSDLLRVIEVYDMDETEYRIENKMLLCDDDTVYLRYLKRVEDPNEYDAAFNNVIATAMALEMCESLTQSNTKKQQLAEELDIVLSRAAHVGALENPITELGEDDWVKARY